MNAVSRKARLIAFTPLVLLALAIALGAFQHRPVQAQQSSAANCDATRAAALSIAWEMVRSNPQRSRQDDVRMVAHYAEMLMNGRRGSVQGTSCRY